MMQMMSCSRVYLRLSFLKNIARVIMVFTVCVIKSVRVVIYILIEKIADVVNLNHLCVLAETVVGSD